MQKTPIEQNAPVRVLIVEDDSLQAAALASQLAAAGFAVDIVGDGLEAVWKVREGCHDVVLIDYRLPEIDGLATARLVCDFMARPARPVLIALTATPEDVDARQCGAEQAFDAVVGKSSDLSALFSVISRCLAAQPERTTRQEALFSLLLKNWLDYDALPSRPGASGDNPGPARILVIDDDECQQAVLRSALERRGYVVEVAANGLDAVRRIRDGSYDVALVDYRLPEIDGLATGRLIHEMIEEGTRPRLIAVTVAPGALADRDAAALGIFDEILPKTSDLQDLMCAIERHMRASPNPCTRRAAVLLGRLQEGRATAEPVAT